MLIVLGIGGIVLAWQGRLEHDPSTRPPLPDQVAAIVDVLERAGSPRRDLVLRALNSADLKVTVTMERPSAVAGRRMPVAEWLVQNYLEAMPARPVEVLIVTDGEPTWWVAWLKGSTPGVGLPVRIIVPLTTGEQAVFDTRGNPAQRVFGVPVGFWVGVLGGIMGIVAILAIRREARPLVDLSTAVARFSADAKPISVPVRGAPDVRNLVTEVNAMQSRIAALVKGRTILLGAVSHDLRTYMTRLRIRVEDIGDELQRSRAVRDLDEMTALIDGAIAIARGEAAVEAREPVDIAALVDAEVAARDGDLVASTIEPGTHVVVGDRVGLRRVLTNVVDNALRYGSHASVRVASGRGFTTIVVDDDGPGIPPDEREAVFEPFYRGDPSRSRDTGGTGLGLAIVRQIVEAHGGRITAGEVPANTAGGTGARIEITLPGRGRSGQAGRIRPRSAPAY